MPGGSSPRRLSLGRWFERSLRPVYVLDEKRTILFANDACLRWLEVPAERIVGQRVDFHSLTIPVDSEQATVCFLAGLCPSPDVLEAGQGVFQVWAPQVAGALRRRQAHAFAMPQEGTSRRHLLVLLEQDDLPGGPPMSHSEDSPRESPAVDRLHEQLMAVYRSLQEPYRLDSLIGQTPAMRRVRRQVEAAAATRANVLVTGESGTGREQVARTIHRLRTKDVAATLIPLDCRILDAELLESTVLGVLRSGAQLKQPGPATLLLLDVDQLEGAAQGVLRAVLERPEFSLGTLATAAVPSPAANLPLDDSLQCVLATWEVRLPSLRDRMADLPLLLQAAVESLNAQGRRQIAGFTAEAMEALVGHPWRRNLDELREVVAESWTRATEAWIGRHDLPAIVGWTADAEDYPIVPPAMASLDEYLASIERELLTRALAKARGNRAEAARLLGIPRARLLRRLDPGASNAEGESSAGQEGPAASDEEPLQ